MSLIKVFPKLKLHFESFCLKLFFQVRSISSLDCWKFQIEKQNLFAFSGNFDWPFLLQSPPLERVEKKKMKKKKTGNERKWRRRRARV